MPSFSRSRCIYLSEGNILNNSTIQYCNWQRCNDTGMQRNILSPPRRRRRRWRGRRCSRGTPACDCGPRTTASSSASSTSPTSSSSTTSAGPRPSRWRTTSQSSCSHVCTFCFLLSSCPGLSVSTYYAMFSTQQSPVSRLSADADSDVMGQLGQCLLLQWISLHLFIMILCCKCHN